MRWGGERRSFCHQRVTAGGVEVKKWLAIARPFRRRLRTYLTMEAIHGAQTYRFDGIKRFTAPRSHEVFSFKNKRIASVRLSQRLVRGRMVPMTPPLVRNTTGRRWRWRRYFQIHVQLNARFLEKRSTHIFSVFLQERRTNMPLTKEHTLFEAQYFNQYTRIFSNSANGAERPPSSRQMPSPSSALTRWPSRAQHRRYWKWKPLPNTNTKKNRQPLGRAGRLQETHASINLFFQDWQQTTT